MTKYEKFTLTYYSQLRVFRFTVAFIAILFLIFFYEIPHGAWALITPITIMGAVPFAGGVLFIAQQRVAGTAIGAAIGLSLFLVPAEFHLLHYFLLVLSVAITIYFAQTRYPHGAIVAALTIVIVAGAGPYDPTAALWRTYNIFWSALLSFSCAYLILPSRAKLHYFESIRAFLSDGLDVYCRHNEQMQSGNAEPILLESLGKHLVEQRKILPHVEKEQPKLQKNINQLLVIERRILTLIEILIMTRWNTQKGRTKILEMEGLVAAKNQLASLFDQLVAELEKKQVEVIAWQDIALLQVVPTGEREEDSSSDISWYGYLWLNRELARQLARLSEELNRYCKR